MEIDRSKILNEIMKYKNFEKKSDFSKFLEIKANVLSNWYTRNSFDELIIKNKIPELNTAWLLTGEGEMLTENKDEKALTQKDSTSPGSKKITGFYFPDVSASAGLENEMNNDELTKLPVTIPGWGDDISFINVYGDSMYPKYNAGEIIGVKAVEFVYLNYGFPYVIVLKNGDVYIKIVQPGSDKNHLSLESTNQFYQPKEFHLKNIKSFYSIKGVIKKEMI